MFVETLSEGTSGCDGTSGCGVTVGDNDDKGTTDKDNDDTMDVDDNDDNDGVDAVVKSDTSDSSDSHSHDSSPATALPPPSHTCTGTGVGVPLLNTTNYRGHEENPGHEEGVNYHLISTSSSTMYVSVSFSHLVRVSAAHIAHVHERYCSIEQAAQLARTTQSR
jgi:hypothetical protein